MENQDKNQWQSSKPKRITITIPGSLFQTLEAESVKEGRSMSNLSAFLLEDAMAQRKIKRP
jgi:hypothetical protein